MCFVAVGNFHCDVAASVQSSACACPQAHKYVIQAEVLDESWKINEAQLAFISNLRVAAKNEIGA